MRLSNRGGAARRVAPALRNLQATERRAELRMSGDDDDVVRVSLGEVVTMRRLRSGRAARIPGCESTDDEVVDHARWVRGSGCPASDTWPYTIRDDRRAPDRRAAIGDALFVYIPRWRPAGLGSLRRLGQCA